MSAPCTPAGRIRSCSITRQKSCFRTSVPDATQSRRDIVHYYSRTAPAHGALALSIAGKPARSFDNLGPRLLCFCCRDSAAGAVQNHFSFPRNSGEVEGGMTLRGEILHTKGHVVHTISSAATLGKKLVVQKLVRNIAARWSSSTISCRPPARWSASSRNATSSRPAPLPTAWPSCAVYEVMTADVAIGTAERFGRIHDGPDDRNADPSLAGHRRWPAFGPGLDRATS